VGNLFLDTVYRVDAIPAVPTKLRAHARAIGIGGMAPNAALAGRRLGAAVHLWSRVGDDATGRDLLALLQAEAIGTGSVRVCAGQPTPGSAILVDAAGERLVCAYPNPALPADVTHLNSDLPTMVDAVLADPRWPQAAELALRRARGASRIAMLDADRAPGAELQRLVDCASHVVCSEAGALDLCAQPGANAPQALDDALDDASVAALLDRVAARCRGATLVAITRGARGVVWRDANDDTAARRVAHLPAPAVDAVDTLGAGDVFHGALAVALAEGAPTPAAIRFASAAAAIKCTRFGGGGGAPTRGEVDAFAGPP
jgi:sulfofructose kinase